MVFRVLVYFMGNYIMKNIDLTKGNIYKQMIRFAVPVFLSSILTLLYNIVDTMIVGKCLGTSALAGVGATGTLMFLMTGLMNGFTIGSSIVTARFFGAKDEKGVKRSSFCSLVLALAMSVIMTAVLVLSMHGILKLMNTDADFYKEAYDYIIVIAWGLVFMTLYRLFEAMLRSVGISKMSLVFACVSFVTNIALDFWFILGLGMGTDGAALATIISFALCALLCFLYILKKVPVLHVKKADMCLSKQLVAEQLKMAIPMSLQHSIKAFGSTLVQSAYNVLGTVPVAAVAVAGKLEHIATDAYSALGSTMSTYCGTNLGAKKNDRIKKGFKAALVIGAIYTAVSGLLLLLFAKYATPLFVSENVAEVKQYVALFMYCVVPFFMLLCILVTFRNGIQGLGFSGFALFAGISELVCRFAMSYFGKINESFVITTLSYPVSWGITSALLLVLYFKIVRKKL